METEDPNLAKPRKLSEEPMATKSITEALQIEPKRATPCTDAVEPIRAAARRLIELESCTKLSADIDAPKRA
jgi:hypothetical protein